MSDTESQETLKIIPKKRRPFRKRKISDDDDANNDSSDDTLAKIEEMKTLQKLREKPNGVSIVTLALGEKISKEEETFVTDPFKVKDGGLINMSALKSGKIKVTQDDAYDTGIGTQFSAETNKRDEDEEMMKYIEEELYKRKKKGEKESGGDEDLSKYCSPEEAALAAVPDHLRTTAAHRSEEMLSNQMLSGIPEVDLGIESKIKNIEATEEAKLKLLKDRKNKKDGPSQFVPTNMAVNFVQHNRFNMDENGKERKDARRVKPSEQATGPIIPLPKSQPPKKNRDEKATDDYHYEKFKKQFRRY